ncbi:MAG: hypothetical protein UU81_C0010G0002 [Microgenomates group bacterium GW2011_GWC1_41_8]|nr:MAG: hypothetical protein UU81_C0010G0002 [Microgenomates group bacterium GW2011_GWC1_41_8]
MEQKSMKFTIPQFVVLSLNSLYFEVYSRFYQSTKGLYALLSCRVACSEPHCFAPRSISSIRTSQVPCFIFEIRRCHYFTMFRNHKRSSQLALKKNFQFLENFNSFFVARFCIFITERRYLRKMSDKKQSKEASLSVTKIEQLLKQPIIESYVSKSEDGKWLIHKTTVTDIKPVSYFEKVLDSN